MILIEIWGKNCWCASCTLCPVLVWRSHRGSQVQHCVGVGLNLPQHKVTVRIPPFFHIAWLESCVLADVVQTWILSLTDGTSDSEQYEAGESSRWAYRSLILHLSHGNTYLPSTSIDYNVKIVQVKVKRIGGAYGSKLNRSASHAMACAFAADKLQKPVRLVLDMATNMQVSFYTLLFTTQTLTYLWAQKYRATELQWTAKFSFQITFLQEIWISCIIRRFCAVFISPILLWSTLFARFSCQSCLDWIFVCYL